MKRGTKIAIAVVACLAIWFVFAIANAAAGNKHGGGIFVMMIMFSIIAFVWRKIVGKKDDSELTTVKLHTGSGEKRFDFEVQLTQDEILQMSRIREQDPEKWKDNEYELVKTIKQDFRIDELEKVNTSSKAEQILQTIKLNQDGIEVSMSLPSYVIEQMEKIKSQEPQKWENNEVELVREAKRLVVSVSKEIDESLVEKEVEPTIETKPDLDTPKEQFIPIPSDAVEEQPIIEPVVEKEKPQPSESLFGNKLESEYRRESKTESHWIRQDDTEICINIEESVYKKMVEMQNENPKKWVNKELDLFQKAKSLLLEQKTPKRSFLKKR